MQNDVHTNEATAFSEAFCVRSLTSGDGVEMSRILYDSCRAGQKKQSCLQTTESIFFTLMKTSRFLGLLRDGSLELGRNDWQACSPTSESMRWMGSAVAVTSVSYIVISTMLPT